MFVGSVTVGDRGQIVIPVEVRKELNIQPGDRLLCFRHPMGPGVSIVKIESVQDLVQFFQTAVAAIEHELSGQPATDEELP
jgi:AbrB family looped-hinge helix DNA binding protein